MARTKQTTRPVMPDPRRHPPTHRRVAPESDITKLARDMDNFKSLLTQQEKNIHAMNRAFQGILQHASGHTFSGCALPTHEHIYYTIRA